MDIYISNCNVFFPSQKLTTRYSMDKTANSTLQDMILLEKSTEKDIIAVDALMWLRRYQICMQTLRYSVNG